MSQWTHVNASIRFDGIRGLMELPTPEGLGRICKWDDNADDDRWDNPDLPCGSEGSIDYTIIKTGSESSLACRAVIFTGDLRDYDDSKEILDYFKRITDGKMIRSGILEIEIEGKGAMVCRYNGDKSEWNELK